MAYRAPTGDVNPHARGSLDATRVGRSRRLHGAGIGGCALVAPSACLHAGRGPDPARLASTALHRNPASPVGGPARQPAPGPLLAEAQIEKVRDAQAGRRAWSPPQVQAPRLGAKPTTSRGGVGLAALGFADLNALSFDGPVAAVDPGPDAPDAVEPAAAVHLVR
ncbi:MAG TPA: hypothetical protein VMJ65_10410 [Solirubrobacteraceae bacterium]|nr:hypothetical protein [Solirubrobacteraceae bacterium]